jgi:hypothetical protein
MSFADAPPGNDEGRLHEAANVENPNQDFFTSGEPVNTLPKPGSKRDRAGLMEFWRVVEDCARDASSYDRIQQAVLTFVGVAVLIDAHFINAKGTREIARALTDLRVSHEMINRSIEAARARLHLHRAHGRKKGK